MPWDLPTNQSNYGLSSYQVAIMKRKDQNFDWASFFFIFDTKAIFTIPNILISIPTSFFTPIFVIAILKPLKGEIFETKTSHCVTCITDKKLNSLSSGRPVLLSRAWWWWWWWSSLWPLWSAPSASISTPDMPRWTRSFLSKFLRDGFTKKVAVLLDFVQMGGRGACPNFCPIFTNCILNQYGDGEGGRDPCPNFLSQFHKLYIASILGWCWRQIQEDFPLDSSVRQSATIIIISKRSSFKILFSYSETQFYWTITVPLMTMTIS